SAVRSHQELSPLVSFTTPDISINLKSRRFSKNKPARETGDSRGRRGWLSPWATAAMAQERSPGNPFPAAECPIENLERPARQLSVKDKKQRGRPAKQRERFRELKAENKEPRRRRESEEKRCSN